MKVLESKIREGLPTEELIGDMADMINLKKIAISFEDFVEVTVTKLCYQVHFAEVL